MATKNTLKDAPRILEIKKKNAPVNAFSFELAAMLGKKEVVSHDYIEAHRKVLANGQDGYQMLYEIVQIVHPGINSEVEVVAPHYDPEKGIDLHFPALMQYLHHAQMQQSSSLNYPAILKRIFHTMANTEYDYIAQINGLHETCRKCRWTTAYDSASTR